MWIKIIIGIVILVVGAVSLALFFNRKVVARGNEFFKAIALKDNVSAYNMLRVDLKAELSLAEFEDIIKSFIPSEIALPVSWNNRSVKTEGGKTRGLLSGVVTLQNGDKVNAEMQLEKEQKVWYINYFKLVPAEGPEFTAKVKHIGQSFVEEILSGNTQASYDLLHKMFKDELSYESFLETVDAIVKSKEEYAGLSDWKGRETVAEDGITRGVIESIITFKKSEEEKISYPVRLMLRKDESANGEWRITQFGFHPEEEI
ncbi:MAG: hypothetical protein QG568_199 [Patescibacteria group bacterium]|nr:hypothetical protein [Patescibacteria group bacterium]